MNYSVKIAILGAAGRMGRWMARHFTSQGHQLLLYDVREEEVRALAQELGVEFTERLEAVKECDAVLVAVPLEQTPKVCSKVLKVLPKGRLLIEISSIKREALPILREARDKGIKPLSLHPLFGPGAQGLRGRRIVVVKLKERVMDDGEEVEMTKRLFPGAEIVEAMPEEHDRAMAFVLGLPHFLNLAFANVLKGEDLKRLRQLAGTSFLLQLILAEGILEESEELLTSLQLQNPHLKELASKLLSQSYELLKGIQDGDKNKIGYAVRRAKGALSSDPERGRAYAHIYRLLEALSEEEERGEVA